jgi:formylglycine-generating enzyme required for sulfatase activity/pimeloyl-ACP methyl ester carboxylesterase
VLLESKPRISIEFVNAGNFIVSILHAIAEPDAAKGSIIFVHGLGGDAFKTWCYNDDLERSWPHWVADEFKQANVYSLEYEANPSAWLGTAMPIFDRAKQVLTWLEPIADRPLIFICHSLGGLLVKEVIRLASSQGVESWLPISKQTRGVVFLATPHTGAGLSDMLQKLGKVLRTTVSVEELSRNAAQLRGLNEWYRNNSTTKLNIRTLSFYETQTMYSFLVVDQTSGDAMIQGTASIPLDANHVTICKPAARNSLLYTTSRRFITDCLSASRRSHNHGSLLTSRSSITTESIPQPADLNPPALSDRDKIGLFIHALKRLASDPVFLNCVPVDALGRNTSPQEVEALLSNSLFISGASKFIETAEKDANARHKQVVQTRTLPVKLLLSIAPTRKLAIIKDQPFAPDLIAIPTGQFLMGGQIDDAESYVNEFPAHVVSIDAPFYLGRFPVTFLEYDAFARATKHPLPFDEGWGREYRPVIHVSWEEAKAFADWLAGLTGLPYRLPTEAEWEYGSRAGTNDKYPWGEAWDPALVNSAENIGSTTPVGLYDPNHWGLYDVLGNVWEWVEDDWHTDYASAPETREARVEQPRNILRCLRGGSWDSVPRNSRLADRCRQGKNNEINNVGFRIARDL